MILHLLYIFHYIGAVEVAIVSINFSESESGWMELMAALLRREHSPSRVAEVDMSSPTHHQAIASASDLYAFCNGATEDLTGDARERLNAVHEPSERTGNTVVFCFNAPHNRVTRTGQVTSVSISRPVSDVTAEECFQRLHEGLARPPGDLTTAQEETDSALAGGTGDRQPQFPPPAEAKPSGPGNLSSKSYSQVGGDKITSIPLSSPSTDPTSRKDVTSLQGRLQELLDLGKQKFEFEKKEAEKRDREREEALELQRKQLVEMEKVASSSASTAESTGEMKKDSREQLTLAQDTRQAGETAKYSAKLHVINGGILWQDIECHLPRFFPSCSG